MKIIDIATYPDSSIDIIEDTANPAFRQAWEVKSRVMLSLSLRERHEYDWLNEWIKEQYLKAKVDSILNFK